MFCRALLKCSRCSYSSFLMSWFCWGKVLCFVFMSFASISFFLFFLVTAFVSNSCFAFEHFCFTFRLRPWRWKQTNKACLQNAHSKGLWRPPYYTPPQACSGAIGPSDDKHNNKPCLRHRQAERACDLGQSNIGSLLPSTISNFEHSTF